MKNIEEYCKAKNLKLTPVRQKVFQLLVKEKSGLGAYRILDLLREAGFNSQPPVAYRALDFLVEHGFVHKIESQNSFVACSDPGEHHSPIFMICKKCDSVSEATVSVPASDLSEALMATGFQVEQTIIEAEGVCSTCADK
jgi:Fur family zinc uptake transcriptional regulator|tara:strand:- start:2151 stop:2570 length:420 start_codon:yes stop_codon:yes gene_type:complete